MGHRDLLVTRNLSQGKRHPIRLGQARASVRRASGLVQISITRKKKILSPPLAGNQGMVTYIQPCLLVRGAFDVAALDRLVAQRRCQPQLIPTGWFHVTVALDATRLRSYASQPVGLNANHHPM